MAIIRGQCGGCATGCGVRVTTGGERELRVEGDTAHPTNAGLLCPRSARIEAGAALDGRLLHPLANGRRTGWDKSVVLIAKKLSTILDRHGPGSIALHVAGDLLTEDFYVANRLMKGFFGSAHIHAPAAMGAVRAMQQAAYGEDVMPATFEDMERADIILLIGANLAEAHPVLIERAQAARAQTGARLLAIVPEGDDVPGGTDLILPVPNGATARLLEGALLRLKESGAISPTLHQPPKCWDALREGRDIWSVARACDLPPTLVRDFFDLWSAPGRIVALIDEVEGEAALAAAINLHLATGRIARAGDAPFILTRAANAMGAREVDCTADRLAAHRSFDASSLSDIGLFWGARRLAQEPGVTKDALLDAIADGRIKALWSIGSDPLANAWLAKAQASVPFAIRQTAWEEEAQGWSVALPSADWVEKDGTLTGMDRLISRHRRLFDLPGEARPDWWIVTKVAQAMGWSDAFHYERAADIYREHVRLTAYRNSGDRVLNLKRHAPISNPAYDELTPWRWGDVPFDEGRFPTPDGRPRFVMAAI